MKENLFRYLTKRACLLGLVAASVIGTSLTLTSCGGGGGDDDDGGDDGEMGGIGEEDDPTALAEHYRQPRLEFNFNTGQCVMYCGCGTYTQNLHFAVRAN